MSTTHKGRTYHSFGVHEVYYNKETGEFTSWSEKPIAAEGKSLSDLEFNFGLLKLALSKPMLELIGDKLFEVKPK